MHSAAFMFAVGELPAGIVFHDPCIERFSVEAKGFGTKPGVGHASVSRCLAEKSHAHSDVPSSFPNVQPFLVVFHVCSNFRFSSEWGNTRRTGIAHQRQR